MGHSIPSYLLLFAVFMHDVNGCRRSKTSTVYVTVPAPEPFCPNITSVHYTAPGKVTAVVSWSTVTTINTMRTEGPRPGSALPEGTYRVTYKTTNGGGSSQCSVSFIVKARRCRILHSPRHGSVECIQGVKYGDNCTYSCGRGFELNGSSENTCSYNLTWEHEPPTCTLTSCNNLKTVTNGLPFDCNDGSNYGSTCIVRCNTTGGYAATRDRTTRCDGTSWSTTDFECSDIEDPVFTNCPSQTIHQQAAHGQDVTAVTWPQIIATDNSGNVPSILPLGGYNRTSGLFPPGVHVVAFDAEDDTGNKATRCTFAVNVDAPECKPPELEGEYLIMPACNPPFYLGSVCTVNCRYDLPVEGNNYITCSETPGSNRVQYWDWGQHDTPPKSKPFCKVEQCPDLRQPDHGALSCSEFASQRICYLHCNTDYDVPDDKYNYEFRCTSDEAGTAAWNGGHYLLVSECTKLLPFRRHLRRLPVYLWYNGTCEGSGDNIKTSFVLRAKSTMNPICLGYGATHCLPNNVKVYCGSTRRRRDTAEILLSDTFNKKNTTRQRRRKRSEQELLKRLGRSPTLNYIAFDIDVELSDNPALSDTDQTAQATNVLDSLFQALNGDSSFTVNGEVINPLEMVSLGDQPLCSDGYTKPRMSEEGCVPCPKGSYYKEELCELCPVGYYQDTTGSTDCKKCPIGFSSLKEGSSNETQCLAMCGPGHVSPTGLVPCSSCSRGTFQPDTGNKSCTACPQGFTTDTTASITQMDCIARDITMEGPVTVNMTSVTQSDVCEFTLGMWVKVETQGNQAEFEVFRDETGTSLRLQLSSDIQVNTESDNTVLQDVLTQAWTQVTIVWTTEKVTIFTNGQGRWEGQVASACPIPAQSKMRITVGTDVYIHLRGLVVVPSVDVMHASRLASSCSALLSGSVFAVDHLDMVQIPKVFEATPSTCNDTEVCADCGENGRCYLSSPGSAYCVCNGGYTGPQCLTPPDQCVDNQCAQGSTCSPGSGEDAVYTCNCPSGATGRLCEAHLPDGEWSMWEEWGPCSVTCGHGQRTRSRYCDSLQDGTKPCVGNATLESVCQIRPCPDCREEDLFGQINLNHVCQSTEGNLSCTTGCPVGLVPSQDDMEYKCKEGVWTPGRVVHSCTEPEAPLTVQVEYNVVYADGVSYSTVSSSLAWVAAGFSCVGEGICKWKSHLHDCDENIRICSDNNGKILGVLTLYIDIPPGVLSVTQLQTDSDLLPYTAEVLSPNGGYVHYTNEINSPAHRDLEMKVDNDVLVCPYMYSQEADCVPVTDTMASILAAWNKLDKANSEVRAAGYSNFSIGLPGNVPEPFLLVFQNVTCNIGSIPGSFFCLKCPAGTYFTDGRCESCPLGFYQDVRGQSECKACPGFRTSLEVGITEQSMCSAPEQSDQQLLVTSGPNTLTIFNTISLTPETLTLDITTGSVSKLVYSATDDFFYYSTFAPATIRKMKRGGSQSKIILSIGGQEITGLAVDDRSRIVFFTVKSGALIGVSAVLGGVILVLSGLDEPRDLVLHQEKFVMYWAEGNQIMQLKYGDTSRTVVLEAEYPVKHLILNTEVERLMWFANGSLMSCDTDGTGVTILVDNASDLYGQMNSYYFYVDINSKLIRVNDDGVNRGEVLSLPLFVTSVSVISTLQPDLGRRECSLGVHNCTGLCWQISHYKAKCS
ncbi:sushi, von Willebrand factor type A, EGF and pentraxin domain-containing protein 1-like [Haliotis cracherodii]|uniref:sushi, von Willebrand factor type A, EGF and pentraxin domain-containing protein 1-like n=1 Tax=Haliotis cracherodii TaxID=6455 RepID=UPI0039E91162